MPWQASVATPLFVSGPGIPQNYVHSGPVTTLDMGGTFLDLAGVTSFEGMTTTSLRTLFSSADSIFRREHVSSGYDNWRMVIKEMPTSPEDTVLTSYKLICCRERACKGTPRTAPPFVKPHQMLLYDTIRDPID